MQCTRPGPVKELLMKAGVMLRDMQANQMIGYAMELPIRMAMRSGKERRD